MGFEHTEKTHREEKTNREESESRKERSNEKEKEKENEKRDGKRKTWPTATDRFLLHLLSFSPSQILTSDVMNEMNSLTHSCTVSFASLATLALGGRAFFIMRAMLAMGRYLSCSLAPSSWADIVAAFCCCGGREREGSLRRRKSSNGSANGGAKRRDGAREAVEDYERDRERRIVKNFQGKKLSRCGKVFDTIVFPRESVDDG